MLNIIDIIVSLSIYIYVFIYVYLRPYENNTASLCDVGIRSIYLICTLKWIFTSINYITINCTLFSLCFLICDTLR